MSKELEANPCRTGDPAHSEYAAKKTVIRLSEQADCPNIDRIAERTDLLFESDIRQKMTMLRGKFNFDPARRFDSACEVVFQILCESKNSPWWVYVNTIICYVDCLHEHSINVSLLSVMLAKAMGVKNLREIALGAFFHDIGKLMIPAEILKKPGKLTNEEFEIVRRHPDMGWLLTKEFGFPKNSTEIIRQHHERPDGSGYPFGLSGDQIPLHTKIVMTADILDAMTSRRPYKPEKTILSAMNELRASPLKYPLEILDVFNVFLS